MKNIKKIGDLFIGQSNVAEYKLNSKYFLFIEKNVDFENDENVLIELHEYVGEEMSDFIETLSCDYNLNTKISKLTLHNIKRYTTYRI